MTAPGLRDAEFYALQSLVYRQAGIRLGEAKRALVVARLSRRVRELGVSSFSEYWARVRGDGEEQKRVVEALCTHETSFFREPRHFEYLASTFAAGLQGAGRPVRVWSAGCSTGEEPFSIAMTLGEALPGTRVEVLATDLSTRVLEKARAATWPVARAETIPGHLLRRYMLRGTGAEEGRMRACQALRETVRFAPANLNDTSTLPPGPFDAIFCRNVLIYFDEASRRSAIERLIDRLAPGGHFFVGHAETLGAFSERLRCVLPTVYAVRQ